MKVKLIPIVLLFMLMQFLGCHKEGKEPVSTTSPQPEGQTMSPAGGGGQQQVPGTFPVKILPESPTAMTDLQVQADFPGADTATYQWQRNGQVIIGESTARLAKNQFSRGDTVSVTVTAGGLEGTASVDISNSSPKVVLVPFSPENVYAGVDLTVNPVGANPTGEEVKFHYKWFINGKACSEDTPVLKGNLFKRGDIITLTVVPYDREGEGEPFQSKQIVIPDAPPRIVSNPPREIQGEVYTYQVVAEDPDGDPLTFSLASAPPGMTIDNKTGVVTWQIKDTPAGIYNVEIVAQDPEGVQVLQKYSISIDVKEGKGK
ncbi:MAG TPA: Ig domain-containing protein [Nitrospirota bacterium]|nr:Ig domain-containing protein [Nitrospirota bacterium]